MVINLQLGSSSKSPENGDIYISNQSEWIALGYFTLVFFHNQLKELRTIPLVFGCSLNQKEFLGKISLGVPPKTIMPIGKVITV